MQTKKTKRRDAFCHLDSFSISLEMIYMLLSKIIALICLCDIWCIGMV